MPEVRVIVVAITSELYDVPHALGENPTSTPLDLTKLLNQHRDHRAGH
jgi:hypothetical protein